jgi:hypothetical protein
MRALGSNIWIHRPMIVDHERFNNLCSAFQSIVLGIAVIVGGVWSAYVFNASLSVENAKAQLEKLGNELNSRPALDIDINAEQLEDSENGRGVILINVSLSNHGNKDTRLNWGGYPIEVERVYFGKDGSQKLEHIVNLPLSHDSSGLRVNDKLELTTVVNLAAPNLYRVTFKSLAGENHGTNIPTTEEVYWFSSAYTVLK